MDIRKDNPMNAMESEDNLERDGDGLALPSKV